MDVENILSFPQCRALTILTQTTVKIKKAAPFKEVVKESVVNGMVNTIYANAMSKATGEDFTPQPRKWGVRVSGKPFIEHKGKKYLEMRVLRAKSKYFADGKEISVQELAPYLQKSSDHPVTWRDYSFDSIKEVHINGESHTEEN